MISARDALEIGLVKKIALKGGDVVEVAKEWSERFTTRSRVAIAMCKKAVRMATELPLKLGEEYEADLFGLSWASEHRKKGIEAFQKREKPEWPDEFG